MTCDKCGKELEVIKTDTGGAFLPCNCHSAAKLIACALRENHISAFQEAWLEIKSQDSDHYVPDRSGFKSGWNAAFYHYNVLKMAKALEIAIESLESIKKEGFLKSDCLNDHQSQAEDALNKINEVCK